MNQKLNISEYQSLALPSKTRLKFPPELTHLGYSNIEIRSVKEIYSSYIVYNAVCHYANMDEAEELLVYEDFHVLKDIHGQDGLQRTIGNETEDNDYTRGFIDYILGNDYEGKPWMITQIFEFYSDEYGLNPSYLLANGTRYYIPSIKPKHLMRSTSYHSHNQSYNSYSDLYKPLCKVNDVNKTVFICPKCGFPCSINSSKCPHCGELINGSQRSANRIIVIKTLITILKKAIEIAIICYIVKYILN